MYISMDKKVLIRDQTTFLILQKREREREISPHSQVALEDACNFC